MGTYERPLKAFTSIFSLCFCCLYCQSQVVMIEDWLQQKYVALNRETAFFLLTWNGNRPVEVHAQTARSNICTWKVLSSRAVFIRPEQLFSNFVVFTEQSDSKKPVTVHAARKAHIGREQIICFYLSSEFTEHSSTKYHQNSGDRYRRSLFRAMTRGFWSVLLFVLITVVTVIVTSDLNLGVSASGPYGSFGKTSFRKAFIASDIPMYLR